ncbi:MAG: class I SAM-dependent methyltransferase [Saprospiraceae bacterium]
MTRKANLLQSIKSKLIAIDRKALRVGTMNESYRVTWLQAILKRIPEGNSILDAGAGECQFKKFCGHLKYTSQDFAQYHGVGNIGLHTSTWDNSKIDIISDITSIPLPDQSVDAVLCTEVFEHIPNPGLAIQEFSRLIRPGGHLIITAPFTSLTHFAPYHFATGLSRFFYEKYLPENNFDILEIDFNGNYFEFVAQEIRRVKYVTRHFTNQKLNLLQRLLFHLNLITLQNLSRKDKGSSELLCFGIHIFAIKK